MAVIWIQTPSRQSFFGTRTFLRHPYLGQAIEASKEFIEYGNQFLCRTLGWHFGETHDVSKEDATICSIKMSVSKMSKISLHPQEYSAQLISTVRLTQQSISEWDIIMLYTIANLAICQFQCIGINYCVLFVFFFRAILNFCPWIHFL